MINFLYNADIERFVKELRQDLPLREETLWPCLNKAADHYGQRTIRGYKVKYNSKKKYYIAEFNCSCGFVYTRRLENIENAYEKSRVIEFGPVWKEKLKEFLTDSKLCINEIARRLDVDKTVVKEYGIKLGLLVGNTKEKRNSWRNEK